ncbi:MAG: OmpA family protein [Elusimicrobiota bacterium]|jgi:outer membrane protein OmpA-like peptidoglycan-associated protein|nr:OmpA family protein [Elusimicrobiota bacterium]
MKTKLPVILSIIFLLLPSAFAKTELITYAQNGKPLFVFNIYDEDGEIYDIDSGASNPSGANFVWTLVPQHLEAINNASQYWAVLLGNSPANSAPVGVLVNIINEANDYGAVNFGSNGEGMTILAAAVLFDKDSDRNVGGNFAQIMIGTLSSPFLDYMGQDELKFLGANNDNSDWSFKQMTLLPNNGLTANMTGVLVHELGHTMGIISNYMTWRGFVAYDGIHLTKYDANLVDSFGYPARPNLIAMQIGSGVGSSPPFGFDGYFNFYPDGFIFFQGEKTMEVLDGAIHQTANPWNVSGLPIYTFAHIALRNSMMSHYNYRNWNTFMEAELALLQDIGIEIDRKNMYGRSIYNDNSSITVTNNFYARNAGGTAYLNGQYNQTPWTIGLHVYGTSNTIEMRGNVLSNGRASAGIRVDGWNNKLTIINQIHADGENSAALMVTYGKAHKIILRGNMSALGENGIGARFDFGDNMLGDMVEYRGSYMRKRAFYDSSNGTWSVDYGDLFFCPELEGALADKFDITGSINANAAAIYISNNALVKEINIMGKASIKGDIISEWNPKLYEDGSFADDFFNMLNSTAVAANDLKTTLTFGYKADSNGEKTDGYDVDFNFNYKDDIIGAGGSFFDMEIAAGNLKFSGEILGIADMKVISGNTALLGKSKEMKGLIIGRSKNEILSQNPSAVLDQEPSAKVEIFVSEINVSSLTVNFNGALGLSNGQNRKTIISEAIDIYGTVDIAIDALENKSDEFIASRKITIEEGANLIVKVYGEGIIKSEIFYSPVVNGADFWQSGQIDSLVSEGEWKIEYASNDKWNIEVSAASNLAGISDLDGNQRVFADTFDIIPDDNPIKNRILASLAKLDNLDEIKENINQFSGLIYYNALSIGAIDDISQSVFSNINLRDNYLSSKWKKEKVDISSQSARANTKTSSSIVEPLIDNYVSSASFIESAWINFNLNHLSYYGQSSAADFKSEGFGSIGGFTIYEETNALLGLYISHNSKTATEGLDSAYVKDTRIGLYGGYFLDGAKSVSLIKGFLGFGFQDFSVIRAVDYEFGIVNPKSDFMTYSINSGINAQFASLSQNFNLSPYAAISFGLIANPEITEDNAQGLELFIENGIYAKLIPSIGLLFEDNLFDKLEFYANTDIGYSLFGNSLSRKVFFGGGQFEFSSIETGALIWHFASGLKYDIRDDLGLGMDFNISAAKNLFAYGINFGISLRFGSIKIKEPKEVKDQNAQMKAAQKRRDAAMQSFKLSAATFRSDSAVLSQAARSNIIKIANTIKALKYTKVTVEGHTDSLGSDSANLDLSQKRAKSVYDEFIKAGIPKEKMQYIGFGSKMPIASNATQAGKADNRRVEIFVE